MSKVAKQFIGKCRIHVSAKGKSWLFNFKTGMLQEFKGSTTGEVPADCFADPRAAIAVWTKYRKDPVGFASLNVIRGNRLDCCVETNLEFLPR